MLFDDVDVVTLVESEVDAVAIPHVVRAANRRTVREIHDEIRRVDGAPAARFASHLREVIEGAEVLQDIPR